MRHFICCMKSIDSYKRIVNCLTDNIEWEEYLTEIDQVQAKIAFINYDLAIIDEKLWWKDEAIDLFTKKSSEIIIFRGNFEDTINEIQEKNKKLELQSTKEEIENKKEDEKKESQIKYVYINTPPNNNQDKSTKKLDKSGQIKEIEKKIPVYVSDIPKDYKKVVAVTGIENTGKSLICLLTASMISAESNKVAILDFTNNHDLKNYFIVTDEEKKEYIEGKKPIKVNKNFYIYSDYLINDKVKILSELKQKYSAVIIDCGSEIDKGIIGYIDTIYYVSDIDISHMTEISKDIANYKKNNILPKTKLIFNKIINKKYVKDMYNLSKLTEDGEIINDKLTYFCIPLITEEKTYDKLFNFEEKAYEGNEELKRSINNIANNIYSLSKEKRKDNKLLKRIFKIKRS